MCTDLGKKLDFWVLESIICLGVEDIWFKVCPLVFQSNWIFNFAISSESTRQKLSHDSYLVKWKIKVRNEFTDNRQSLPSSFYGTLSSTSFTNTSSFLLFIYYIGFDMVLILIAPNTYPFHELANHQAVDKKAPI